LVTVSEKTIRVHRLWRNGRSFAGPRRAPCRYGGSSQGVQGFRWLPRALLSLVSDPARARKRTEGRSTPMITAMLKNLMEHMCCKSGWALSFRRQKQHS